VGTSLRPRTSSRPWYGVDTEPGHAARTGPDPGSSDGSQVGRKEKHFLGCVCALCVDGVWEYLAIFPTQSRSPKGLFP
jgi:hypothetical protein